MIVVGAPVRAEGGLFNAAVVIHRGADPRRGAQELPPRVPRVLREAPVPRRARPRRRQVRAARRRASRSAPELLFACRDVPGFVAARRDLRGPVDADPAQHLRSAGRRDRAGQPVGQQHHHRQGGLPADCCAPPSPARAIAAYLYTAAGLGESTTDLAWDGQALIYENGELLAESRALRRRAELIVADIDLDRLLSGPDARPRASATRSTTSASGCAAHPPGRVRARAAAPTPVALQRRVERFPYVPADPAQPQRTLRGGLQHPGQRARRRACGRPGSRSS